MNAKKKETKTMYDECLNGIIPLDVIDEYYELIANKTRHTTHGDIEIVYIEVPSTTLTTKKDIICVD